MNAQTVNTVGGICELAGVVLAVRELVEVVEYQGGLRLLRSSYQRARDVIVTHLRRLLGRPINQTIRASGIASTSAHAGVAIARGEAGQPTVQTAETLEDRMANLEQRLLQLDDQLGAERQERQRAIEHEQQRAQQALESEARRLRVEIGGVRGDLGRLEQLTTGDVRLRRDGIALLLVGVVLTTWPAGVAAWLPGWITGIRLAAGLEYYLAYRLCRMIVVEIERAD